MINPAIVSSEVLWAEIRENHNPDFIERLLQLPGAEVYVSGGMIVDLSLGRQWKDLDLVVALDIPAAQRRRTVEETLTDAGVRVLSTLEYPNGVALRSLVPGDRKMSVDINVVADVRNITPDFTASGLFVNLKTGEVVEARPTCLHDFNNKIVRSCDEPHEQIAFEPRILFRALKFALKTGFSIDPVFEKAMREESSLIQSALTECTSHIARNGKDSVAEYYLGNIFGGLKIHAERYVEMLYRYGFLQEMAIFAQRRCNGSGEISIDNYSTRFATLSTLEEKISLLLSIVSRAADPASPPHCFEILRTAFALNTARSDGNEFVVDPTKIEFS